MMQTNLNNNISDTAVNVRPDKNDAFLCYVLVASVYIVASVVLGFIQNAVPFGSVGWWICLAISSLCIGLSAVAYCLARRRKMLSFVAANVAPDVLHTVVGCVFIVGLVFFMSPLTNWIYDFMEWIGLKRPSVNLPKQLVPLLLVATLLPAVTEEIVFRGVVGNGFVGGYANKTKAVLLSGALFALFHANPAQTLHQFFVGCFLTLLLLRSGSLWCCVIVHFVNNLLVVIAQFTLPEVVFTSWISCLVGGVVAACAFVFYLLKVKPTKNSFANGSAYEVKATPVATAALIVTVVLFCILWVMNL